MFTYFKKILQISRNIISFSSDFIWSFTRYLIDLTKIKVSNNLALYIAAEVGNLQELNRLLEIPGVGGKEWPTYNNNATFSIAQKKAKINPEKYHQIVNRLLQTGPVIQYLWSWGGISPVINRKIDEFNGKNLILGCGTKNGYKCDSRCYPMHPSHEFYSVDLNASKNPDLIADLRDTIPQEILPYNHFSFILFENLDYDVMYDQKSQALVTAALRLKENGVILLTGIKGIKPSDAFNKLSDNGIKYGRKLGHCLILTKNLQKIDLRNQPAIFSTNLHRTSNINKEIIKLKDIESLFQQLNTNTNKKTLNWF